jgi:cytochrome c1
VQGDPETGTGAFASRPVSTALAEHAPTLTGGAGLFDHSARDAVSRSAALVAGVTGVVLTFAVAAVFVGMNPSFENGKAGGTPNQLAAPASAATALQPGTPAFEGAQIIATKPCTGCHMIPGVPGATGQVGPNLAGVASRPKIAGGAVANTGPADLKKWISDPSAVKPGTAMPKVPLTDDELDKVVAFLETLK